MRSTTYFFLLTTFVSACGGPSKMAADAIAPRMANLEAGPRVSQEPAAANRVLIRDADLTFEVTSTDQERAVRTKVVETTAQLGGYVSAEYEHSIVLRVPSPRIDEALSSFDQFGKIARKSIRVQEVTAQHTDLSIRIENARRLRERLQSLLADAKTVQEMLDVEKELARVTQELELYEGQMRVLENRVQLSTINVDFEDAVTPGPIGWVFYGLYEGVKWLFVWD